MEKIHKGWRPRHLVMGGALGFVLLAPLIGMRVSDEVNWTLSDFVFAGLMVAAVSATYEFAARRRGDGAYRAAVLAALAGAFMIVWTNGAVGIIGNEENPVNLIFTGVLAVALIGSLAARFRAKGMALALLVTAVVHGLASATALAAGWDFRGSVFSLVLAAPWLISAALFRKAAG